MHEDARTEIRAFVVKRFPDGKIADDQDIFATGFVNSLFAMELVMFIEKHLDARLPNTEVKLDNFRSVDSMVELVDRQTGARESVAEQVAR